MHGVGRLGSWEIDLDVDRAACDKWSILKAQATGSIFLELIKF